MTTNPAKPGSKPNLLKRLGKLFQFGDNKRQGNDLQQSSSDSAAWPVGPSLQSEAQETKSLSGPCLQAQSTGAMHLPSAFAHGAPLASSSAKAKSSQQLRAQLTAASEHTLHRRFQAAPVPLNNKLVNSLSVDFEAKTDSQRTLKQQLPQPDALGGSPMSDVLRSGTSNVNVDRRPITPVAIREPAASGSIQPEAECPPPQPSVLLTKSAGAPSGMHRPEWSLADYNIARRLYKGAGSAVYQATCKRTGTPVALKVYFLSKIPANAVHMVAREIMIHAGASHKNIIKLYGAFQEDGKLVLVQEFASRGDLYGIHRAMGHRMSEEQVQEVVLVPFLEALSFLHARGVCHRDVKPENILFSSDWRLKIADFGVSIDLNQERAVTRAGTLDYMAPEVERCPLKCQPHDNKDNPALAYTTAVDIWAVGVLIYELLVGFPPFVADTPAAAAAAANPQGDAAAAARLSHSGCGAGAAFLAAHATRQELSFPGSVSAAARDFIRQALAERPSERPTAAQLLQHPWARRAVQRRQMLTRTFSGTANTNTTNNNNSSSATPPSGTVESSSGSPARTLSRLTRGSRGAVGAETEVTAMAAVAAAVVRA